MTSTQNFNCIFCKETFKDKEALQIHFRKHGDSSFNQNKLKKSLNDVSSTSDKTNHEMEMVSCDACSEEFPTISKAITHKHKVHPDLDAKYFCPWCGKLFTLKYLFNKHLQTSHEEASVGKDATKDFHCDCCDVDFYAPSAMLHHNKFFHRQETELAAIGQSKKQKFFHQELLPVYYCTFCGEEYNNKINLHKHMSDDHSDENQSPNEVLRCPLCEAIFYHLDAYELHLTFHSSEDLFTEKNDMHTMDITEYTLETVPPIMEAVENWNHQQGDDNNSEQNSIEDFLQMAMIEDGDGDKVGKKAKKHKKHKKSKKAAITLDEFLNMNSDVFGEGLDFQGIEEVPTQVVAKRLKAKKPQVVKSITKPNTEIEKLLKLGVSVKKKPEKGSLLSPGIMVSNKMNYNNLVKMPNISNNTSHSGQVQKATSSNAILSRFMNQNKSEIKITKRPSNSSNLERKPICEDEPDNIHATEHISTENNSIKDHNIREINGDEVLNSNCQTPNQDGKLNELNTDLSKKNVVKQCINDLNTLPSELKPENASLEDDSMIAESNSPESINQETDLETIISDSNKAGKQQSHEVNNATNTSIFTPEEKICIESNTIQSLKQLGGLTIKSVSQQKNTTHDQESLENNKKTYSDKPLNEIKGDNFSYKSSNVIFNAVGQNKLDQNVVRKCDTNDIPVSFLANNEVGNNKNNTIVNQLIQSITNTVSRDDDKLNNSNKLEDLKPIRNENSLTDDILDVNDTKSLTSEPINLLKHLGNITIKSVNQTNKSLVQSSREDDSNSLQNEGTGVLFDEKQRPLDRIKLTDDKIITKQLMQTCENTQNHNEDEHDIIKDKQTNLATKSKGSLDILKKLGNISVKTMKDVGLVIYNKSEIETHNKGSNVSDIDNKAPPIQNKPNDKGKTKLGPLKKLSDTLTVKSVPLSKSTKVFLETAMTEDVMDNTDNMTMKSVPYVKNDNYADTKKNITNPKNVIPLPYYTNIHQPSTIKSSTKVGHQVIEEQAQIRKTQKEIEIFNIDDSDSEEEKRAETRKNISINTDKPIPLKNLTSDDTVSSITPQCKNITNEMLNVDKRPRNESFILKTSQHNAENLTKSKCEEQKSLKDVVLQNTLKNLSKQITIKSKNFSPTLSVPYNKSLEHDTQVSIKDGNESDSDSLANKVKITELEDENFFQEGENTELDKSESIIHHSDDSNSSHENYDKDFNDHALDIESQISTNTLKNPTYTNHCTSDFDDDFDDDEIYDNIGSTGVKQKENVQKNKDVTITPIRNLKPVSQNIGPSFSKAVKKPQASIDSPSNLPPMTSYKTSTVNKDHVIPISGNKNSTVNKEVTVKTYQTQTVIEEITTTVTKTVRTVKQEVQNTNAITSCSPIGTQRINQRKTNQQCKIPEGTPVKYVNPTSSSIVRNSTPIRVAQGATVRPSNQTVRPSNQIVRPSNQLVPFRPGTNVIRQNSPRMPVTKKNMMPSFNQPRMPLIGKPLKISPQVMTASIKRSNPDDISKQISSYKKPKESTISSAVENKQAISSRENNSYTSSSHISKCNFSSVTKSIQGNTITTTIQQKSDVITSAQHHIDRLNNQSGIKIVKTSQTRNVSEVEEKSDNNVRKRTTSEAIEKLQKQGLLVKKPKLNISEDSEHSDIEDEEANDYLVKEYED